MFPYLGSPRLDVAGCLLGNSSVSQIYNTTSPGNSRRQHEAPKPAFSGWAGLLGVLPYEPLMACFLCRLPSGAIVSNRMSRLTIECVHACDGLARRVQ